LFKFPRLYFQGIWIHVEGDNTPKWDADGYVTGLDNTGTMVADMKRFLDAAGARDIVVIPVLWNAALMRNQNLVNLHWDDAKLQSYIDNALIVRYSRKKIWICMHRLILCVNAAAGVRPEGSPGHRCLGSHERT
jgi:hypothetical protein